MTLHMDIHQMINTEIKLITFFVDKDVGEAAYSQQNKIWSWLWLRSTASHSKFQAWTKERGENH